MRTHFTGDDCPGGHGAFKEIKRLRGELEEARLALREVVEWAHGLTMKSTVVDRACDTLVRLTVGTR